MVHRPLITPAAVSARLILLLYAACGVLIASGAIPLVACSSFGSVPGEVADPQKNAVLCSCECDPPADPVAVPFRNHIFTSADDAAQGINPPANLDGNQLALPGDTGPSDQPVSGVHLWRMQTKRTAPKS